MAVVLLLACSAPLVRLAGQPQPSDRPARGRVLIILPPGTGDTLIILPHGFLQPGSDTLFTAAGPATARDSLYTLEYAAGRLRLPAGRLPRSAPGDPDTLLLEYGYLPLRLRETFRRRALAAAPDSARADTVRIAAPIRPRLELEDIFGRNLQKSGSLFRGFTVGSGRELSLNSGFRMQLSGRIGPDLDVTAALTDENTPIQPEGTTQTLQEFDRVFVDIRKPSWGVTLGDFPLLLEGGEFARITRKVQGAQADARGTFGTGGGAAVLAGAATRGKYHANAFTGIEGVQGPYRLTGRNGERGIILIAGTERVFLNGERMVRGETQDYVVDYATAEIRFTARRLMTGASRLLVEFEYSDRQYARSLVGANAGGYLVDSLLAVRMTYLREADDPDAPLDRDLPDSLRSIIAAAGDRREDAVVSGIRRVDSGGVYVRVDSLTPAGSVTFYRFAPGDPAALYLVTFSDVGNGRGAYIRRAPGEFEYRGPGGGAYAPVVLLPFAQSLELFDVAAQVRPAAGLHVEGEFAGSVFSPNRISARDVARRGNAWSAGVRYGADEVRLGGVRLGRVALGVRERRVGERFTSAERTTEVEFGRRWALDSLPSADERIREAVLEVKTPDAVDLRSAVGYLRRGGNFRSTRTEAEAGWEPAGGSLRYRFERIGSSTAGAEKSLWWRHGGGVRVAAGPFEPALRFEAEDRMIRREEDGAIRPGSFAFHLVRPRLAVTGPGPLRLLAEAEWRADDAELAGERRREAVSLTQTYGARLEGLSDISGGAEVTLRRRTVDRAFTAAGGRDARSVLVQSAWRYAEPSRAVEADVLYQVLTERSALLERVFVRVAPGSGTYRYLGDLNANGLADEAEFEQVRFDGDFLPLTLASDDLTPVIDLRTSARVRVSGARLFTGGPGRWFGTESYVRIEEKSTEEEIRKITLLRLGTFRNETTTIAGSILLTQDLLVLEGDPVFSGRLRFQERRGLVRLSGGVERQYTRERSFRLRWQAVRELAQQADLVVRDDHLGAAPGNPRARRVRFSSLALDISYRPEQQLELGIRAEVGRGEDAARAPVQTADLNSQAVRIVATLGTAGQARAEGIREDVRLRAPGGAPVYELTGGRVEGKTWIWRTGLDYRILRFLQAGASYEGRAEGGRAPVHTARAEVRAYF